MGVTSTIRIARAAALGVATLIGSGLSGPTARAAYTVTLEQEGSNVVATGSGSLDISGLSFSSNPCGFTPQVEADVGFIQIGASGACGDIYSGVSGPSSFGSGGLVFADSSLGDFTGISDPSGALDVPQGYVSGTTLTGAATWTNESFSGLGVTPGTYEWTWGTGAHSDSFTLQVGAAAVPEPASLPLLVMGLAGLGLVVRTGAPNR